MTIKWKIIKKNPEQGCVEVLWHDDASGTTVGPYNCDILDAAGQPKTGQALLDTIHGYTPMHEFQKAAQRATLAPTALDHIDALLDVETVADLNVFVTQAEVVTPPDPVSELVTVVVL